MFWRICRQVHLDLFQSFCSHVLHSSRLTVGDVWKCEGGVVGDNCVERTGHGANMWELLCSLCSTLRSRRGSLLCSYHHCMHVKSFTKVMREQKATHRSAERRMKQQLCPAASITAMWELCFYQANSHISTCITWSILMEIIDKFTGSKGCL